MRKVLYSVEFAFKNLLAKKYRASFFYIINRFAGYNFDFVIYFCCTNADR